MSQEISSMYNKIDKKLSSSPKDSPASSGLISKRGPAKDNSSVVDYVKKIRKMRGELNVK